MQENHFDVLIVGAGLSGIGAAFHLQKSCPRKTYAILEGRERMGGTWDLFRYPGIRSDSDMYTLGYAFRPWTNPKAIADGPSILSYIEDTARENCIDRHVRYNHRVESAAWSSKDACWTVGVTDVKSGQTQTFTCSFLFACAGYYDYDGGYTPDFPGRESFRGMVVHPQKWPDDLDYEGKRVVIIGSGATAVTLLPELAKKAAHVTMLQRSPTYIVSAPQSDPIANFLREKISPKRAYSITRWKNVLISMGLYQFSRRQPERAKKFLIDLVRKQVGEHTDVDKNFTPTYNPWDQRLCLVPDSDLFKSIRAGKSSVVTDHIERFTEKGILLKSGQELEADIIVTATGLKLKFLGGLALDVDGKKIVPSETMAYKAMMLSDVPNLALAIGYTNASWTLKCDLTCEYVCRLLNHMEKYGYRYCVPRRTDPDLHPEPFMDFQSGYVQRSVMNFPRQGNVAPWRVHQNYALDRMMLRNSNLEDGSMEFARR